MAFVSLAGIGFVVAYGLIQLGRWLERREYQQRVLSERAGSVSVAVTRPNRAYQASLENEAGGPLGHSCGKGSEAAPDYPYTLVRDTREVNARPILRVVKS